MKVELCAASIEAIQLAKELSIDRIELCQNLEQGGMTPSPGFINYAIAYGLETHVLIRPRPGGFRYDSDEVEIMLRDIHEAKVLGAKGVVVGVLNEYGVIDRQSIEKMVQMADGMDVTFHRAFDDIFEFEKSIDLLVELGVKRILTSGLGSTAERGVNNLKEMVRYAKGSIEIMPGGGINQNNIQKIVSEVKPSAIHFSGTKKHLLDEESQFSETILKVSREKVIALLNAAREGALNSI